MEKISIKINVTDTSKKHVMQLADNGAKFKDGGFRGSLTSSAGMLIITLDDGRQYTVETIDILKGLKKAL